MNTNREEKERWGIPGNGIRRRNTTWPEEHWRSPSVRNEVKENLDKTN